MSWSTGYTKIKENYKLAQEVMAYNEQLGIDIGTPVIYREQVYKVKQLWITELSDNRFIVRVEVEDKDLEDFMLELDEIKWGPEVELLYGKN